MKLARNSSFDSKALCGCACLQSVQIRTRCSSSAFSRTVVSPSPAQDFESNGVDEDLEAVGTSAAIFSSQYFSPSAHSCQSLVLVILESLCMQRET